MNVKNERNHTILYVSSARRKYVLTADLKIKLNMITKYHN